MLISGTNPKKKVTLLSRCNKASIATAVDMCANKMLFFRGTAREKKSKSMPMAIDRSGWQSLPMRLCKVNCLRITQHTKSGIRYLQDSSERSGPYHRYRTVGKILLYILILHVTNAPTHPNQSVFTMRFWGDNALHTGTKLLLDWNRLGPIKSAVLYTVPSAWNHPAVLVALTLSLHHFFQSHRTYSNPTEKRCPRFIVLSGSNVHSC